MLADDQTRALVNAIIYGSVLKGFMQQKNFDRVWTLHGEMQELRLQYSIVTFNILVDVCAHTRGMDRVPALLEEMERQGIPPNVITYGTIIKGYCHEYRVD